MEAAWQFTSRALKILRLCWIQQAFPESLLRAGPYARWSSLRCSCARSGKGSQPGSRHFPHSVGRCCASRKRGGHGAPQKAYQPRLEKGMPGLGVEGCHWKKIGRGTHHGGEQHWVLCVWNIPEEAGSAGDARSSPQPKNELDLSMVQSAPPRRFSSRARAIHRLQFHLCVP